MEEAGPSLEPEALQRLRHHLAGEASVDVEELVAVIQAQHLEEEAEECLRASRRGRESRIDDELVGRLHPLAAQARQRREAFWQLDSRRTLVRFDYAKVNAAADFDLGDLQAIFLRAFRLEGFPLALDLGKRPRPMLGGGLPLPAGVDGLAEIMDVVLKREPEGDPRACVAKLNGRLPLGLSLHGWRTLPLHASPVCDLALCSHWRWSPPGDLAAGVRRQVAAFLDSPRWPWDRGPSKASAGLDLRDLIADMVWDGETLCFSTAMGDHQAISPLKMLGAILGMDVAHLTGLVRTRVEFRDDSRLAQGYRFEPKLKNMYEDAVLLGGGSNITLVDEDDDEPIRLG
jgi:radical SAM-linked protein